MRKRRLTEGRPHSEDSSPGGTPGAERARRAVSLGGADVQQRGRASLTLALSNSFFLPLNGTPRVHVGCLKPLESPRVSDRGCPARFLVEGKEREHTRAQPQAGLACRRRPAPCCPGEEGKRHLCAPGHLLSAYLHLSGLSVIGCFSFSLSRGYRGWKRHSDLHRPRGPGFYLLSDERMT